MVDLAFLHKDSGMKVLKSDNSTERFDVDKIISSCMNAGASSTIASEVASEVSEKVYDGINTHEIRAMIYTQLRKRNLKLAERYKYRQKLRVRTSKTILDHFDRQRIVDSLIKETKIDSRLAETIAKDVEKELGRMRLDYVTAPLIREIVNVKLLEHGLEGHRARYTRLGMPVYDVKNLIEIPSKENANLQYNPESIHKLMADQISKEYALINILPMELADSHMRGEIHIHDLDYFIRPFCFSHDIRFFLKNGFKADGVGNHTAIAGPSKRPEVAFLHAAKILAAAQTNCFHPDEPVLIEEDNIVKTDSIKNVVNKLRKGKTLCCFGFNENYKIVKQPILDFNDHIPHEDMLEITLENGKRIRTLENHPLFYLDGATLGEKSARDIKIGDYIPIPISLPSGAKIEEINILEELTKLSDRDIEDIYLHDKNSRTPLIKIKSTKREINENATLNFERSAISIPVKIRITKELMRLLGYYVSEGHITWYQKDKNRYDVNLSFGLNEKELIDDAERCIKKIFGLRVKRNTLHGHCMQLSFGGKLLALIFKKIFLTGRYATEKSVPWPIFNVDNELKSEFIKAYFHGDGHIHAKKEIVFDTVSEGLASDLSFLFLQLGIITRTRTELTKGRTINGRKLKPCLRYRTEIATDDIGGIADYFSPYRFTRFEKYPMALTIPTNHIGLQELYSEIKPTTSPLLRSSIMQKQRTARKKAKEFLGTLKSHPLTIEQSKKIGEIESILNGDIGFLRVKNIKKIKKPERVYDITTPSKSFVGCLSGVLAHNCAGGQGFSYFNTFLAPYISGMGYDKVKQLAQMFIYELSVDGEEKIPILDNGEFKVIKIGEFVDKLMNNSEEVIHRGSSEIVRLEDNYRVLSFDETGVVRFLPITGVSRHKTNQLYEITTKFGKKVRVTGHHSLFTFNGEAVIPIRAEELNEGDYVVGIKNIDVSLDKDSIDLYSELCKLDRDELRITNLGKLIRFLDKNSKELGDSFYVKELLDGKRTISVGKLRKLVEKYGVTREIIDELLVTSSTYSKKKYYLPFRLPISDEFLRLIGYYLAEGYLNKGDEGMGVGLGIDHNQIIKDDVNLCVKKVFNAEAYEAEEWNLRFGGKLGAILFRDILKIGEYATNKKLPGWVLILPKHRLREVIKAYATSDGCVSDARLVSISTSSKELVDQLRFMFLRFGIVTRHRISRFAGEKVEIKGIETKANADSHVLYIGDMRSAQRYLDEIGFVNEKFEKLIGILNSKGEPQTPEYMLAPFDGRMVNVGTLACNPLKHDACMEKVTRIEKIDEEKYVYDLEVEPTQNFCTLSGLSLHNSQMYVARGGQVVFSSIDCDMSVPKQFEDVPAVLPGGVVKDTVTYADYEDEVKTLFNALLDVYLDGDYIGKMFNFPKFEVQIHPKDIKNGKNQEDLIKVSKLAAKFGTPYYIVNQPYMPEFACYQCCSFLMPLDDATTDDDVINGTIRGGGLQVVTINLPQLAYEANGDDNKLFELLRERMEKTKDVLLLKKEVIHKNLKNNLLPFMNQPVNEKERYLKPEKQSFIIGLVGMNELVKAHTGEELHESDYAWEFGLRVMKRMKDIVAEFRKETGLNFALARTPAESCAYRLAEIDLMKYKGKAVVNGPEGSAYYTNSFHVNPSADVPLWKRLTIEGAFHPLTDGGAMSHVFLGESNPSPEGIHELTKKIATKTAIQYFAFTKDLSVCRNCSFTTGGLVDNCPNCGGNEIDWWSRITGYYQNIGGWNKGKLEELKDRRRYGISGTKKDLPKKAKKKINGSGVNGWDSDLDF